MIYLIGSLRNPEIPVITKRFRDEGLEIFADWYAAGPEADDYWRDYEKSQGFTYIEALSRPAAKNVYAFDRRHLEASDVVVLVLPAGKSGHLELGWALGRGKRGYILVDSPERWDVMYQFATGIYNTLDDLIHELKGLPLTLSALIHPLERPTPEDLAQAKKLIEAATRLPVIGAINKATWSGFGDRRGIEMAIEELSHADTKPNGL